MSVRTTDFELAAGAPLRASAIEALGRTFRGPLLRPGDDGYTAARQLRNAMIDRRPALIARCLGVADVASALGFAREAGAEVAVRAGGHSIVGHSMIDGAVVIDISLMRGVEVDRRRRRARVQGGAMIGDLDRETQHAGLATTGGLVASTGVGGLTLGGGYGWLARRFGLACDNLRSAEVVLADGSVVTASADDHADLFWALRGGGGNFGVVTSFELELHPFGPTVARGDAVYGAEDGLAALRTFRDVLADAPDELYLMATVGPVAPELPVPADGAGRPTVHLAWAWLGDRPRDGERVAQPLHRAARPIAQSVDSMSYVELQSGSDGLDTPRRRMYWKSSFLRELTDDLLATVLASTEEANAGRGLAFAELLSMGGAIGRVPVADTAYSHRDAVVDFLAVTAWTDPLEDDARIDAARRIWDGVTGAAPLGVYVNNLGSDGQDRVREAYGPETYRRLTAVKLAYDPDNRFRHTANIRPGA